MQFGGRNQNTVKMHYKIPADGRRVARRALTRVLPRNRDVRPGVVKVHKEKGEADLLRLPE